MKQNRIGLVLDGGGGKGAYQIGVWKAMREFGLDKQVAAVAGTSVGGLNAALFVQGDYDLTYHIWSDEISRIRPHRLQMDLEELIDQYIDFSAIQNSPIDCFLATHSTGQSGSYCEPTPDGRAIEKYVNGEMTYYNLRVLSEQDCQILFRTCTTCKAVMLATSSLPLLCRQVLINGRFYKDGGWGDNCPVYPLSWQEAGCDTILVVHLSHLKTAEKEQYPGVRILEIVPNVSSQEMGLLSGTLNFKPEHARLLMEAGYRDSRAVFEKMVQNALLTQEEEATQNWKRALEEKRRTLPTELRAYYEQIMGRPYTLIDRKED